MMMGGRGRHGGGVEWGLWILQLTCVCSCFFLHAMQCTCNLLLPPHTHMHFFFSHQAHRHLCGAARPPASRRGRGQPHFVQSFVFLHAFQVDSSIPSGNSQNHTLTRTQKSIGKQNKTHTTGQLGDCGLRGGRPGGGALHAGKDRERETYIHAYICVCIYVIK